MIFKINSLSDGHTTYEMELSPEEVKFSLVGHSNKVRFSGTLGEFIALILFGTKEDFLTLVKNTDEYKLQEYRSIIRKILLNWMQENAGLLETMPGL